MHGSSCRASAVAAGSGAYADVLAWSRKSNASLLDQTESVSVFSSMVCSRAQVESRRAVYIRQGNSEATASVSVVYSPGQTRRMRHSRLRHGEVAAQP
jgi:hypothetical protein